MSAFKFIAAFVGLAGCVSQIAVAEVYSFTNNLSVPDGQPAGVSDVETVSSGLSQIGSVQVVLNIVGNFNGDLFCYLQYDDHLAVLLNRPGRTAGNSFGYDDSGFSVTLSDTATNGNIHTYGGVVVPVSGLPLTGAWQPDGRTNSPATVLDTNPSTAGLGLFDGLNPSGNWTLFLADLSPGGTSVLNSWQLIITPVPEPSALALEVVGLGALLVFIRKVKNVSR